MDQKLEEIKKESPNVQTMSIVADLGTLFSIQDYQTTIADKLKDLDVAILALNAGFNKNRAFKEVTDKDIQDTVMLNALHPAYLAKVMCA